MDDYQEYWKWRINDLGFNLISLKKPIMSWENYEEKLYYLKIQLENNSIPLKETGDLTTYYYWKTTSSNNIVHNLLPSESMMKQYYKDRLQTFL